MKRMICLLTALLLLVSLCACAAQEAPAPAVQAPAQEAPAQESSDVPEIVKGSIDMGEYGVIEFELYPRIAPQSVYNFCALAREGFYDGLIFHRVIKGFMIQGGDPTGTGFGGPGYSIKGEFGLNGISNSLSHTRGVISMARSQALDSAGSQFFIVHKDSTQLDGQYAAFGRVTDGMETVDRIANIRTDANDRPYKDIAIQSITIEDVTLPAPEKLPEA